LGGRKWGIASSKKSRMRNQFNVVPGQQAGQVKNGSKLAFQVQRLLLRSSMLTSVRVRWSARQTL
jgi:hypothetical protein